MMRAVHLFLIAIAISQGGDSTAQQIYNNGVKTACIERDCRSQKLPRRFITTRRPNSTVIELGKSENDLRVLVVRPYRVLNTTLKQSGFGPSFSNSLTTDAEVYGDAVEEEVSRQNQAAEEVIPSMNRTLDPIIQISDVAETTSSKENPEPPSSTPTTLEGVFRQTLQRINQTFSYTPDVNQLRPDVFDQPFSEAALSGMRTP